MIYTFLSTYPFLWCLAHPYSMGWEAVGFNFWSWGVVMASCQVPRASLGGMLVVGVSSSSLPRGAWCWWWFLPSHSRLCFWLFLCFLTCVYTLLFLHWFAIPHYPWIQSVGNVLDTLDTFSYLSLKPQICISLASYRWIFIALGSWVSLCARSNIGSCLQSSALHHASPLLRPPLWYHVCVPPHSVIILGS